MPKQVIVAWVLSNLNNSYETFVSTITQSYQANSSTINIENLFSNLIDESRRLISIEGSNSVLFNNNKNKSSTNKAKGKGFINKAKGFKNKQFKVSKDSKEKVNKFCTKCKKNNHNTSNCYLLFPEKAPKGFINKGEERALLAFNKKQQEPSSRRRKLDAKIASRTASKKPSKSFINFLEEAKEENSNSIIEDNSSNIEKDNSSNIEEENSSRSLSLQEVLDLDLDTAEDYSYNNSNKVLITLNSLSKKLISNFILDSGSTTHIVSRKELINNSFKSYNSTIKWGDNSTLSVKGKGNCTISIESKQFVLQDCLYVPSFDLNLISISKLEKNNIAVLFQNNKAIIYKDNKTLFTFNKIDNLYQVILNIKVESSDNTLATRNSKKLKVTKSLTLEEIRLWHKRLGHKNLKAICKALEIPYIKEYSSFKCSICINAKLTNIVNKEITTKASNYLDKVVLDLCGPITPSSLGGGRYILFLIDSAYRFLEFKILKAKSEALDAFREIKTRLEKQSNSTIKVVKSDWGGEFNNSLFNTYLKKEGIIQQFSSPRTPEQNGLIERVNRTILETTRSLLYNSKVPFYLWAEAVNTAVYIYNITPHSSLQGKIPYKLINPNLKINYNFIKVWGSIVYYKDKTQIKKLDPKAKKGILIGFNNFNSYKVLDLISRKTIWTRDLQIFEEEYFSFNNKVKFSEPIDNERLIVESNNLDSIIENLDKKKDIISTSNTSSLNSTAINTRSKTNNQVISTNPIVKIPTKSREELKGFTPYNLIVEEEDYLDFILSTIQINNEPNSFKEAINCPNKFKWLEAMNNEFNSLLRQNTWQLVSLPKGRKALKGR